MIRKSMWLASAGLFVLATPALAQQPETQPVQPDTTQTDATPTEGATADDAAVDNTAAEQQPVDTGNIIITATRRNQALSDVPMAVSAVTADTLQNSRRNRHSPADTSCRRRCWCPRPRRKAAPQSRVSAASARSATIPGLEGSVATYIDGVYRSRTGVALTELGPLDRIEVLRGPQGTLFGRNASAGVISVITAKPQFTTFVSGAAIDRQLRLPPLRQRRSTRRSATPSRRGSTASMSSATASSRTSFRAAGSTTATAICCAARCCSSPTTISPSA